MFNEKGWRERSVPYVGYASRLSPCTSREYAEPLASHSDTRLRSIMMKKKKEKKEKEKKEKEEEEKEEEDVHSSEHTNIKNLFFAPVLHHYDVTVATEAISTSSWKFFFSM